MGTVRVVAVLLLMLLQLCTAAPSSAGEVRLTVLHTNDMHARFEETNQYSGKCNRTLERCYGGFARVANRVRHARREADAGRTAPVLFLNAGDTFQGSTWYKVFKWRIAAKFINILNPDAISLGNHEFDDRVEGLAPFIDNVTCPVLAANLDISEEPSLSRLTKSTVFHLPDGSKVAVIGYLTPETQNISSPEKVKFKDEVESISAEVNRYKAEGIKIFIALGHSGFETDKKIAKEVPDIDLVIGGHTNTFLFTGNAPDREKPEDLYPKVIEQANGRKVYVVQAYAFTKYLGNLSVEFDKNGEVKNCIGNPILLDNTIQQDQDVLEELERWRKPILKFTEQKLGYTKVLMDGDSRSCRNEECNFGNFITDAFVHKHVKTYNGPGWSDAPIAIVQGGGIRNSIDASHRNGEVSMEDVSDALPFDNPIVKVELLGKHIYEMLEWAVFAMDPSSASGNSAFLQVSGLKITYNLYKNAGSRVVKALSRCGNCRVPTYSDVFDDKLYTVLVPLFLYSGGDGFSVFTNKGFNATTLDSLDYERVAEYIKDRSPIYPAVEGRIEFENKNQASHSPNLVTVHSVLYIVPLTIHWIFSYNCAALSML